MIAMMLAVAVPPVDPMLSLYLSCKGHVAAPMTVETAEASARTNSGSTVAGQSERSELVEFDAVVGFRLENGLAQMRVPPTLLAGYAGGDAGWYKVKNLTVSEREITGKVSFNFLSSSTFRIDRMTGEITTSGGFNAACEPEDRSQRKF